MDGQLSLSESRLRRFSGPLVAILVVVMAVAAVVAFAAEALHWGPTTPVSTKTDLSPTPARPFLAPVIALGQPPADIVDSLVVPEGASTTGYLNSAAGASQYDATVKVELSASVSDVVGFYAGELRDLGWNVRSVGQARGGPGRQVIAIKQSRDTYTWEVGVTASAEPEPTGANAPPRTLVAIRLFQMSDG